MGYFTEPSGQEPLESVWKTRPKYLAGDWTNRLSITVDHGANFSQSNRKQVGKSNSCCSQSGESENIFSTFLLLSSSDIADAGSIYANILRSSHGVKITTVHSVYA